MIPPVTRLYAVAWLVLNLIACAPKPKPAMPDMPDMPDMPEMHHQMAMSERASAFTQTMRRLWAENVILRRRFVENGSNEVRTRFLAKQEEIANAIAPYYGTEIAQKVAGLLKQRAVMAANDPHAHENSAAIAALLRLPSLTAMLDALLPMRELSPSFTQGMQIADEIANNIIKQYPQQF